MRPDAAQWIVVLFAPRADGTTDKIPVDFRTGMPGVDAHDARNWTTYETATATAARLGGAPTFGVGFVLTTADDYFCVDIDGALRPDDTWSSLAQQIASELPGCMLEVSHSGRGLHVWGRYPSPPPHRKKRVDLHIECYTEARFIAWGTRQTGTIAPRCDAFPAFLARWFPPIETTAAALHGDGPRPDWRGPADDDDLIRRARQSRSAAASFGGHAAFDDLWTANADVLARAYPHDTEPYDRSSADAALAAHLAFWTGCDLERMDRLMRRSALVREKWERHDYLPMTLRNAAARQQDVLQDRPVERPEILERAGSYANPPPPVTVGSYANPPGAQAAVGAPALTPLAAVTGETFLSPAQQAELFAGCVYVVDSHRVLTPGGRLLKPDQFRAMFGGYSYAMDNRSERVVRNAFEAFTESQALRAPRADGTMFKPRLPYGTIVDDGGRRLVNTWWPPIIRTVEGDVEPLLAHIRKLYPDPTEQRVVLYTMACIAQYPGHKAQWAPVLQGVEGNGKTFLATILQYAVGPRYTYWPRAHTLSKDFNGYLVDRLLMIVEELMLGDRQDLIDLLKPLITSDVGVEVERKGIDQTTADICCNWWFNTNHRNALRKTRNDRRFAVLFSAQQTRDDLARDGITPEYMRRLYTWAKQEEGLAKAAHYLRTVAIPADFDFTRGAQRAPDTRSTSEAINASMTATEQEVLDAIEREDVGFRGNWVSSGALDRLLERTGKSRYAPINTRRALLQSLGYDWHPALTLGRVNNPVPPDGAKVKLFCRVGSPEWALTGAAVVADAYARAQGVSG